MLPTSSKVPRTRGRKASRMCLCTTTPSANLGITRPASDRSVIDSVAITVLPSSAKQSPLFALYSPPLFSDHCPILRIPAVMDPDPAWQITNHAFRTSASQSVSLNTAVTSMHVDSSLQATTTTNPAQPQLFNLLPPSRAFQMAKMRSRAGHYMALANRMFQSITQDWVPEVLTAEQKADELNATRKRVEYIESLSQLHDQQKKSNPNVPLERLEYALFAARVDYRAHFPRIFRINDLPNEILCNIFSYACWSAPDPANSVRYRLYISWVCPLWRQVIIGDKSIWNNVLFTDYPNYERSMTWLERAGNTTLDVRIADTKEKPWTVEIARVVIDKVFAKLTAIRTFVVVLQDWDPILHILQELGRVKRDNLRLILERLEFHRTGHLYHQTGIIHDTAFYSLSLPLFGGAPVPSLKHLTASAIHIQWTPSVLRNLITFDMRRIPLDRLPTNQDFRTILMNSPFLDKLVLDSAGPRWPVTPTTPPPIVMQHLISVAVGDFRPAYGAYCLSQFTCPNALDLTLMNLIREDYTPIYQALTGATPKLRVLTLFGSDLPMGPALPSARIAFVQFLAALPELALLRINKVSAEVLNLFMWDTERMVSAVGVVGAVSKIDNPVCPKLETLEYHNIETPFIATWVAARRQMGFPLKNIYVGDLTAKDVTPVDRHTLISAMGGHGVPTVLNAMTRPKEETDLLRRSLKHRQSV